MAAGWRWTLSGHTSHFWPSSPTTLYISDTCTHTPARGLMHTCVTLPPLFKTHTQPHTSECFQDTKGSLICSQWPTLASWRATSQIRCVFFHCRRHAKHQTVFNIQNIFPNMLLPRISLLGQIIQLSVCLLLIPKLGGGSTYHLFCRLVFLQNTTIKIAWAVIKMAQRQIWHQAKTRGNEGGGGSGGGLAGLHSLP